jgi:rRNA maturation endonuclease Nob1
MDVFLDFPLLSLFITIVTIVVLIKVLSAVMGGGGRQIERQCGNCGTVLPGNAVFCGRCGSKVGEQRNRV